MAKKVKELSVDQVYVTPGKKGDRDLILILGDDYSGEERFKVHVRQYTLKQIAEAINA